MQHRGRRVSLWAENQPGCPLHGTHCTLSRNALRSSGSCLRAQKQRQYSSVRRDHQLRHWRRIIDRGNKDLVGVKRTLQVPEELRIKARGSPRGRKDLARRLTSSRSTSRHMGFIVVKDSARYAHHNRVNAATGRITDTLLRIGLSATARSRKCVKHAWKTREKH